MMMQKSPGSNRSFLAWVWAGVLVVAGLAYLASNTGLVAYSGPLTLLVAGGVALLSLPFLGWWLADRQQGWALIAAWVFISLALLLVVIFANPPYSQLILITALAEIAAPFLVSYLTDRRRWWALITSYALLALGGLLALTILSISSEMLGAFALLAVASPFWLVYMLDRQSRWALVPAGFLSVVGVGLLIFFTFIQAIGNSVFFVILNGALAVVCLAIWLTLRRLDWALWFAVSFTAAAILSIWPAWFPPGTTWALLALTLGGYIAYRQIRDASQAQTTVSPPPAQQPAQAQPTPVPPAATASKAPPTTPPTVDPGLAADREATAAAQTHLSGKRSEETPVIEFRPLNPFEPQESKDEEQE